MKRLSILADGKGRDCIHQNEKDTLQTRRRKGHSCWIPYNGSISITALLADNIPEIKGNSTEEWVSQDVVYMFASATTVASQVKLDTSKITNRYADQTISLNVQKDIDNDFTIHVYSDQGKNGLSIKESNSSIGNDDVVVLSLDLENFDLPQHLGFVDKDGKIKNESVDDDIARVFGNLANTMVFQVQSFPLGFHERDQPKIAFTNVPVAQKSRIIEKVQQLGIGISKNEGSSFETDCTHLVTPSLDINNKIVLGLSNCCDIVGYKWLHDIINKIGNAGCSHLNVNGMRYNIEECTVALSKVPHTISSTFDCCTLISELPQIQDNCNGGRIFNSPFVPLACLPKSQSTTSNIGDIDFSPNLQRRFVFKHLKFVVIYRHSEVKELLLTGGCSSDDIITVEQEQEIIRIVDTVEEKDMKNFYLVGGVNDQATLQACRLLNVKLCIDSWNVIEINDLAEQVLYPEKSILKDAELFKNVNSSELFYVYNLSPKRKSVSKGKSHVAVEASVLEPVLVKNNKGSLSTNVTDSKVHDEEIDIGIDMNKQILDIVKTLKRSSYNTTGKDTSSKVQNTKDAKVKNDIAYLSDLLGEDEQDAIQPSYNIEPNQNLKRKANPKRKVFKKVKR